MSFRLRTIDRTADGREIVRDRDVAKPAITVGRAAENDVHLPDLAVEPAHARIVAGTDGTLRIEALGTRDFYADGKSVQAATIPPGASAELRFGSYRVTIAPDSDGTVLLTIAADAAKAGPLDKSAPSRWPVSCPESGRWPGSSRC